MNDTTEQKHNREAVVWIVVILLSLVGVWWVDRRAEMRGRISRDPEVAALNQKIADATLLLSQYKADAELHAPIAKAQRSMADAALEAATKPSKKHSAKLTESLGRLKALRDAPAVTRPDE